MVIKILLEFTGLFKLQNVVQIQFISIQARGGGAYIRGKWTCNWVGGGGLMKGSSRYYNEKKESLL